MASTPPRKGPKMTRISSHAGMSHEEAERLEFEAELNASADRVLAVIEESRSRMTDTERENADRRADSILKNATENAGLSRRRA